MRLVAPLLAGLILLALVPPSNASDDCANARINGTLPGCVAVPLPSPAATVYVMVYWVQCAQNPTCDGTPAAHFVGIIWQESNGVTGLQRTAGNPGPHDTAILY